jgi:hypothetical protein
MTDELKKIIESSTFVFQDGRFIVAKVKTAPAIDDHFMVSKDRDEITVVTKEENLEKLDLIEKNKDFYVAFELKISLPFYAVGFLAAVTGAMGERGMNNLVISTYSKDYLFVRVEHLEKAQQALLDLGFKKA